GPDHRLEVAVEGDAVALVADLPAQALGGMQLREEQHHALARRPPFQRPDMAEGVEPARVTLEQGRGLEVRDEAAEPVRPLERLARERQAAVAGEEPQARQRDERRHAVDAVRAQRISETE